MNEPNSPERLQACPGDVLISSEAIPYPGDILQGFNTDSRVEPYFNLGRLRSFLEFLEYVILCERLICPVPSFLPQTNRIVNGKGTWLNFVVFGANGDLDFSIENVGDKLADSGVLISAVIDIGDATSDDTIARLMPSSSYLQRAFAGYLHSSEKTGKYDKFAMAQAHMAARIGTPLHIAEAARIARLPYILGEVQSRDLVGYESEILKVRRSVTQILVERLNHGAREELAKLANLGAPLPFPETPFASLIVQNATTPRGMLDAALQLRSEFALFRREMNQIEADLTSENLPTKIRLKRLKEIEWLADSLWRDKPTDLRATAMTLSDALLAVPEALSAPSLGSVKTVAEKFSALPVDRLLDIYRQRKVRLLIKAKKSFLNSASSLRRLAKIFDIPESIALQSQHLKKARLKAEYARKYPDIAAEWYRDS